MKGKQQMSEQATGVQAEALLPEEQELIDLFERVFSAESPEINQDSPLVTTEHDERTVRRAGIADRHFATDTIKISTTAREDSSASEFQRTIITRSVLGSKMKPKTIYAFNFNSGSKERPDKPWYLQRVYDPGAGKLVEMFGKFEPDGSKEKYSEPGFILKLSSLVQGTYIDHLYKGERKDVYKRGDSEYAGKISAISDGIKDDLRHLRRANQ
jgi:hypothetical protein